MGEPSEGRSAPTNSAALEVAIRAGHQQVGGVEVGQAHGGVVPLGVTLSRNERVPHPW